VVLLAFIILVKLLEKVKTEDSPQDKEYKRKIEQVCEYHRAALNEAIEREERKKRRRKKSYREGKGFYACGEKGNWTDLFR
jgi:hypothetical protein